MTSPNPVNKNLRQYRPAELGQLRLKEWANNHRPEPLPQVYVLSSRTVTSWASLGLITGQLESEFVSASVQNGLAFDFGLLEHAWRPSLGRLIDLKVLALLHIDEKSLRIAQAVRTLNPAVRIIYFLSAEAVGHCAHFFSVPTPFPVQINDLFLTLCGADASLVRTVYPQAQVETLGRLGGLELPPLDHPSVSKFVYAGRLSFNKNVHSLIFAYALAAQKNGALPPLHLYGNEDSSVQQFQETRVTHYLDRLRTLVDLLGVGSRVHFHAHAINAEWENVLREEGSIYVSASVNLDENYGIAPREFLAAGHRLILSDWGGFREIIRDVHERVLGVPTIRTSAQSVQIDVASLMEAFHSSWVQCAAKTLPGFSISARLTELLAARNDTAAVAVNESTQETHRRLREAKARQLHDSGPYRHLLTEAKTICKNIDHYSGASTIVAPPPGTPRLVPWVTRRNGFCESLFQEASPIEETDHAGLWAQGWCY